MFVLQLCSSAEVIASLRHLDDVLSDLKPGDVDAVFLPENFSALAATNPRAIGDAETYGAGEIKAFVAGKAKGLGTYILQEPYLSPKDRVASMCRSIGYVRRL